MSMYVHMCRLKAVYMYWVIKVCVHMYMCAFVDGRQNKGMCTFILLLLFDSFDRQI